ncbi:MAG: aldo/keto reductase [Verrucomicrobia bacterium]|nr:aldo/keto reductase [Verrucomicrobiota bacterium]
MNSLIAGKPVGGISLGCATFGREIDEAASRELMDYALGRGVTLFDTAAAYGAGESERIVGRWLADRRPERLVVATKLLPPYDPAKLEGQFAESLRRLGLESVDLLYLHHWHATAELPGTLQVLDQLVRTGRVRALGASNFSAAQLDSALSHQDRLGLARFAVVQNNHNFAVSDLTPEFLALCAIHRITVVTYSPLGAGFLTGKHRAGVQAGSRFALVPGHQDIYFQEAPRRRLAELEAIAARHHRGLAELALAWALRTPGVDTVLIGGRGRAHLDQAFAAQAWRDPKVLADLGRS